MQLEAEAARQALQKDNLSEAEAICLGLLEANPEDAVAASLLGAVALKRGDFSLALEWTDRARALGLADFMVLSNAGEARRRLGQFEEAFRCFELAIKLDGSNPIPFFNMGHLMRERGNARVAEHFFRSALILNPAMGKASLALAELYREEGHTREAAVEYANALSSEPDNALWRARLGTLLLETGATVEALAELARAVAIRPMDAPLHLDLARAEFELCRERYAQASLERGLSLESAAVGSRGAGGGFRAVAGRYRHVHLWSAEPAESGATYRKLAAQVSLQLPELHAEPPEAAAYYSTGGAVAPDVFLAKAPGVEVLPDFSVLAPDRSFLVAGLVNWAHHYPQKGGYAHHSADDDRVLLKLPGEATEIAQPSALIGGAGDHFAWMFEALPRFWALEQGGPADAVNELALIVPAGLSEERVAMLEAMGIDRRRLLFLPEDRTFRVADLRIPSLLCVGHWISPMGLQFVRRKFAGGIVPGAKGRRVYFSRRGMADSRLANEADLAATLAAHGFEEISVSGLSPLAVMAILREAEAVLAVDGDILANLPAAPLGTLVGAVVPSGLHNPRTYFVSAQLGQRFVYLIGEPVFASHPSLERCDIVLAPQTLAGFLDRLRK